MGEDGKLREVGCASQRQQKGASVTNDGQRLAVGRKGNRLANRVRERSRPASEVVHFDDCVSGARDQIPLS
jgi:hypothetical protein